MVRLKEFDFNQLSGVVGFQFHYGTIKSLPAFGISENLCISIPLWYD